MAPHRAKHFNGGFPPPLIAVQTAVRIAAEETKSQYDHIMIQRPRGRGKVSIEVMRASRAKIYAGLALRAIFLDQCDDEVIAKQLYVGDYSKWFYQIDHRM